MSTNNSITILLFFIVENKYATYEQRVANIPTDTLYKQMNVLDKVTDNALKVSFRLNVLIELLLQNFVNRNFLAFC